MKVTIYQMGKPSTIIYLELTTNIREFRSKIAKIMDCDVDSVQICNIKNQDDQLLGRIYSDDPVDENLISFMKAQYGSPECIISEMKIWVMRNLGPGMYRPTIHNPKGVGLMAGLLSSPESRFFQRCAVQEKEQYSVRLERIGCIEIPEKFLDPITMSLMDNPIIASDGRTYDSSTLQRLGYISPFSRETLSRLVKPNLALYSEIESFVENEEARHLLASSIQ